MDVAKDRPKASGELGDRLRELEAEAARLVEQLRHLPGTSVPGAHVLLTAGQSLVLLPAGRVRELIRLVAVQPLPGAPPELLGAFSYRGETHYAVDLALALEGGPPRPPKLDAMLVVLNTTAPLALVVAHVDAVVTDVTVALNDDDFVPSERLARLAPLLCMTGAKLVPRLEPARLAAQLEEVLT